MYIILQGKCNVHNITMYVEGWRRIILWNRYMSSSGIVQLGIKNNVGQQFDVAVKDHKLPIVAEEKSG